MFSLKLLVVLSVIVSVLSEDPTVSVTTSVGEILGRRGEAFTMFLGVPYGDVDENDPLGNAAKLKYHIVAMHTSETPYRCAHCSAAFGWYSSLYRHVREVHYKMKVQPKKSKKVKKSEVLPSLLPPQVVLAQMSQAGPP